jgi:predicted TIM-barrel fold metal-dependent hydrolase
LPARWRDDGPRVVENSEGYLFWQVGDSVLHPPGYFSVGSTTRPFRWEDVDPACYEPHARLRWMDRYGIAAQVLYPNVVAFEGFALMKLAPELQQLIFRAYNDHQSEISSIAPDRLVPIAAVPFWDRAESIREMERCRALGHRGVLWASTMAAHGLPSISDPYWDEFYAAAQDLDMPVNFHVGIGGTATDWNATDRTPGKGRNDLLAYVKKTGLSFMANADTMAELIMGGVCHRFPQLRFVSVESGFGYVPFVLDALDWQWTTSGAQQAHADRLLPSDYFKRQIYATFWFEHGALPLLRDFSENVMFETDFPHPTSLTPAPYTIGIPAPDTTIERALALLDVDVAQRVFHDNAAELYQLA